MKLRTILLLVFIVYIHYSQAQNPIVHILDSNHQTSLRGMSVVDKQIVWCSGNNGVVAKSINGGKTFTWMKVKGFELRDFRDIEAFDENNALIIAVAEPAVILKTSDGGQSWKKVFEDSTKGMFLDAMDFADATHGVVVGDPIDGKFYQAITEDGGNTWKKTNSFNNQTGEAFFASSGTNVIWRSNGKNGTPGVILYVSGGTSSQLYIDTMTKGYLLPITQGKESTGANAIATRKNKAVIVGGDYANDKRKDSTCALVSFKNNQIKITVPDKQLLGYKSSVIYTNDSTLIACGTTGIDISINGGIDWRQVSKQSFHVVQRAKHGNTIYLAGSNGRIARLEME